MCVKTSKDLRQEKFSPKDEKKKQFNSRKIAKCEWKIHEDMNYYRALKFSSRKLKAHRKDKYLETGDVKSFYHRWKNLPLKRKIEMKFLSTFQECVELREELINPFAGLIALIIFLAVNWDKTFVMK